MEAEKLSDIWAVVYLYRKTVVFYKCKKEVNKVRFIHNWGLALLFVSSGWFVSCDHDEVELVDVNYKALEVSCGSDFTIPVLSDNWGIEYVKDVVSGQEISDKNGNSLALDGNGKVEASNGWLELSRNSNEAFVISLRENFDQSHERKLLICIIDKAGKRDYMSVVQHAGTEYQLVKSTYEEIEDLRTIYVSDKGCTSIVLNNPLSTEVWEPTGGIYKEVVETSMFESDDYGAFAWIPNEGLGVTVPDLIINDTIRGGVYRCLYKEGLTSVPYIKDLSNGNKILMHPYSTLYLSGEITYCKRVCNYTFTIQNVGTGTQFDVSGVWTQIVPLSSHTISSDKRVEGY